MAFPYQHPRRRRRRLIVSSFFIVYSNLYGSASSFSTIATRRRIRRFNNNVKNEIQRRKIRIFRSPQQQRIVEKSKTKTEASIKKRSNVNAGADTADLDRKLMNISFFSFLHQASTPFSELIDSAYLSRMDSTSLGAMGVAMSSQVC